jgi:7-carboxy-7-deazaguanine synthase
MILLTQAPDDIFYSPSGEGLHIGTPKVFLRTQGCPHRCLYCDSASTWLKEDGIERSFEYILEKVIALGKGFFKPETKVQFEITGGEATIQYQAVINLINFLKAQWPNSFFTLQTAGSVYSKRVQELFDLTDHISFDHKDPHQGIPFKIPLEIIRPSDEVKLLISDWQTYLYTRDYIRANPIKGKYVITAVTDYRRPDDLVQEHVDNLRYWVDIAMADPGFDTTNVQFFPRLHSLLWLTKKGV